MVELRGGNHRMETEESILGLLPVCLHLSRSQVGLRIKFSLYFYFTDGEILEYIKILQGYNFQPIVSFF